MGPGEIKRREVVLDPLLNFFFGGGGGGGGGRFELPKRQIFI